MKHLLYTAGVKKSAIIEGVFFSNSELNFFVAPHSCVPVVSGNWLSFFTVTNSIFSLYFSGDIFQRTSSCNSCWTKRCRCGGRSLGELQYGSSNGGQQNPEFEGTNSGRKNRRPYHDTGGRWRFRSTVHVRVKNTLPRAVIDLTVDLAVEDGADISLQIREN